LALLSVAFGAFGAHGLRGSISDEALAIYQTGVQYQMFHAMALLVLGTLRLIFPQAERLKPAGWLFLAGIVIFSGSLYALALSGVSWLGAITPIGGVCFLTGWALFTWAVASLQEYSRSS